MLLIYNLILFKLNQKLRLILQILYENLNLLCKRLELFTIIPFFQKYYHVLIKVLKQICEKSSPQKQNEYQVEIAQLGYVTSEIGLQW
ncbi:hypothetical protein pb186bvf_011756 [Paramecium bursaria]